MLFALLSLLLAVGVQTMRADAWDKATKITFSESVQVPGKVLQPGTYYFKLLDSPAERHVVQIFNEDHTQLITTVLAIPNQRLEPAGKTILTYEERPSDQPMALKAWFYPGDNFGQQFVYPKSEAQELSRLNKTEVPSTESEDAYPGQKAESSEPEAPKNTAPEPEMKAENTPPPQPTPSAAPETHPAPAPSPAPQEQSKHLPKTASQLPLFGLTGFLMLVIALLLRKARRA
jgi:LPXTG-motif cell wall-anchored protein